jgi:hypothetical protein
MTHKSATLKTFCIIALGLLLVVGATSLLDSSVLIDGDPSLGWFNMVNLHHNAFHSWRFGNIKQLALKLLPAQLVADRSVGTMSIMLIGMVFLLRSSGWKKSGIIVTAVASFVPLLAVLLTVGIDPLIFGAMCWLPIMVIAARHVLANPNSLLAWSCLAVVSVENSFCANQVAIISTLYALWLTSLLHRSGDAQHPSAGSAYGWMCIVLLLPAVLTAMIAPMPFLPQYPKSSHVTIFESVEGYLKPLIGHEYPFDIIDRYSAKELYGFGSRILLALCGCLLLLARVRLQPYLRNIIIVSLGLALTATLDTTLPEDLAMIAPLASISRLLPWGTTFSMTSIALGFSAFGIGYVVALNHCPRSYILASIAGAALSIHGAGELYYPYLRSSGLVNDQHLARVLRTPSASLVRALAMTDPHIAESIHAIEELSKLPTIDLSELEGEVSISPAPSTEALATARQLEKAFRWSTRTGAQVGNELLTLRFPRTTAVRGVELNPGAYATDYPRGLLITGGECSKPGEATILHESPVWQGPLEVTSRGIPYFASRNRVRVVFPESISVECLFIRQTARAPYDWSIAKIGIMQ